VVYASAKAAGAEITRERSDTDYRSRSSPAATSTATPGASRRAGR